MLEVFTGGYEDPGRTDISFPAVSVLVAGDSFRVDVKSVEGLRSGICVLMALTREDCLGAI